MPSTALGTCVGDSGRVLVTDDRAGRITAYGVADGAVAWQHSGAGRLIHCDDRLALTARIDRGLRVEARALAGGDVAWMRSISVPGWVSNASLSAEGWTDRRGYGVRWSAATYWEGGYPPSPEEEAEATRNASGAVVIDSNQRIIELDAGTRPRIGSDPVPAAVQAVAPRAQWTLDGNHAWYRDGDTAYVVDIGGQRRASFAAERFESMGHEVIHVTGAGLVVFVTSGSQRRDGRERAWVRASVFQLSGARVWTADIVDTLVPDPVP